MINMKQYIRSLNVSIIFLILFSLILSVPTMAKIIELDNQDFEEMWYSLSSGDKETAFFEQIGIVGRAFSTNTGNIYFNKDAIWFDNREKQLTLQHEIGHTKGLEHSILGIMSPLSFIRYITVWSSIPSIQIQTPIVYRVSQEEYINEIPIIFNTTKNDEIIEQQINISEPIYKPTLRQYDIDKSHDIWMAKDPKSYIIPDNEWVKYVASQLFIDYDGNVKFNNVDKLGQHTLFINNYIKDDEQFNYPPNSDYWVNADYYLSHGNKGDCEDFTIALTSIFISGEVSIKEGSEFIKQIIPAKVVVGDTTQFSTTKNKDSWVEYTIYNNTYIGNSQILNEDGNSITMYYKKSNVNSNFDGYYEFTDKYFKQLK